MTSAWLLVLIAADRLVRARFPHRQARLCTRKVAAWLVGSVCACATLFTSHVLQPVFAFTSQSFKWCGPARSPVTSYTIFYSNTWPILQLIITYILPSGLMIVSLIRIQIMKDTKKLNMIQIIKECMDIDERNPKSTNNIVDFHDAYLLINL